VHGPKLAISAFILLVIGLHAAPILLYRSRKETLWPFLMWAMYKDSRPAGPVEARNTQLMGITAQGNEHQITSDLVGLPKFTFREMYIKNLRGEDSTAAQQLMRKLNRGRKDPFIELRLVTETYRLTDGGVMIQHNPIISFRDDSAQPD
jgi:hypothetical protein